MLQPRHLVLIRAALQYWDEEQSPHGTEAFNGYVDESLPDGELTAEDVTFLRTLLPHCQHRYALCNDEGRELIHERLFETIEEAAAVEQGVVAAVLIFRDAA